MPRAGGLYFESHGPADSPALILSSGLGGSADYWAPNLPALAERNRVVVYDHRGTGRSDRSLPPRLRVGDMAQDVLTVMDAAAVESASLIGHAAGGAIGLSLALLAPRRIERLVAINAWAAPDPHFARCFEARLALLKACGVGAFVRAQPIFLYPSRWSSANHARLEAEEAVLIKHFPGVESLQARVAALLAFDIEARLVEIAVPVLLIAAEDDALVPPSCSERLARGLPDATLMRMTGGHACNIAEAESFDQILSAWLAGALTEGVS
ncbi:pyrimidine utilization protein D [Allosphingosinicella sp.]|jgi:aminoacrylate hydrolase|uniref:pyrimidine utilization protein D n=1 Tax=Allosphingosinicella sp. TaxID=2823234 RepID=UPI002F207355